MAVDTLTRVAPQIPPGLIPLVDAARERGVTRRTLERRVAEGKLRTYDIPGIRKTLLSRTEVELLFNPPLER